MGGEELCFLHLLESCALPTFLKNSAFFFFNFQGPCVTLLRLCKAPPPTSMTPSDKPGVHPFHQSVCWQIECLVCADWCHRRCLHLCALGSAAGWHPFQHVTETMIDMALRARVPTTARRGGNFLSDFIILGKKKTQNIIVKL